MKRFFKKLKKHWITVWLVAAVLGVGIFVVIATYTGIYSVKRVVSMKQPAGVLFSSSSMQPSSDTSIPTRHLTTSQSSGKYVYNLTVCDFAQSDPLTRYVSENGLYYDLTAQLCVKQDGEYYPVSATNVTSDIKTHAASTKFAIQYVSNGGTDLSSANTEQSLAGGAGVRFPDQRIRPQQNGSVLPNGTNKYAVTFDPYELGDNQPIDYYIKVRATPTDNSLPTLSCYLYLTRSVTRDSAWRGRLQELTGHTNYDAYNYIIEGSGKGEVTVRWNSSYIDVSEVFLAQNGLTGSVVEEAEDANHNVWKYFVLDVGDEVNGTVISRYELQLYKNKENANYSNVLNYISCTYVAD